LREGVTTEGTIQGCVSTLLLISLIAVSGCGSGNPVNPADQYQQKVYIIGEIKDPGTDATEDIFTVRGPVDAVKCIFVRRVDYNGTSADAPIFLAADQALSLSSTTACCLF